MVTAVPPMSVPPAGDTPVTAGSVTGVRAAVPGQAHGQGRACRYDRDGGADRESGPDRAELSAVPEVH